MRKDALWNKKGVIRLEIQIKSSFLRCLYLVCFTKESKRTFAHLQTFVFYFWSNHSHQYNSQYSTHSHSLNTNIHAWSLWVIWKLNKWGGWKGKKSLFRTLDVHLEGYNSFPIIYLISCLFQLKTVSISSIPPSNLSWTTFHSFNLHWSSCFYSFLSHKSISALAAGYYSVVWQWNLECTRWRLRVFVS